MEEKVRDATLGDMLKDKIFIGGILHYLEKDGAKAATDDQVKAFGAYLRMLKDDQFQNQHKDKDVFEKFKLYLKIEGAKNLSKPRITEEMMNRDTEFTEILTGLKLQSKNFAQKLGYYFKLWEMRADDNFLTKNASYKDPVHLFRLYMAPRSEVSVVSSMDASYKPQRHGR